MFLFIHCSNSFDDASILLKFCTACCSIMATSIFMVFIPFSPFFTSVRLEQGVVTSLLEGKGTIRGVQYKTKDGRELTAYAPLTIVCDGCFSNLRRSLCNPQASWLINPLFWRSSKFRNLKNLIIWSAGRCTLVFCRIGTGELPTSLCKSRACYTSRSFPHFVLSY